MSDTPQTEGSAPEPAETAPTPAPSGGPPPHAGLDERRTSSRPSIFLALGLMAALVAAAVAVILMDMGAMPTDTPADGKVATAKKAAPVVPAGPPVELQLILATGGEAHELEAGQDVAVGDQVVFQVTAEEPARVRVWAEVEGLPHQQLGTFDVEGTAMLGSEEGLAGFGFGNPGPVVFRVSSAQEGCPPGSCASWAVIAH